MGCRPWGRTKSDMTEATQQQQQTYFSLAFAHALCLSSLISASVDFSIPDVSYTQHHNAMLCYAKSLQSCLTLCDPIDGSPSGSSVPGVLQARIMEWVAISFSNA